MLKQHSKLFENLLLASDLGFIVVSWVGAFMLRFYIFPMPEGYVVPGFWGYAVLLLPIVLIWPYVFKLFGLYRPKRIGSRLAEVFDIAKACVVSVIIMI